MTELWHCTDCPAEVDFDHRHEHMETEHGVNYSDVVCGGCHERIASGDPETFARVRAAHERAHKACPDCTETEPCERAKALEARAEGYRRGYDVATARAESRARASD